LKPWFRCIF